MNLQDITRVKETRPEENSTKTGRLIRGDKGSKKCWPGGRIDWKGAPGKWWDYGNVLYLDWVLTTQVHLTKLIHYTLKIFTHFTQ